MTTTYCHQEAALEYAGRGLRVLPLCWMSNGHCSCGRTSCPSPAKHPVGKLVPHGLHDASSDPTTVASWWDRYPTANIGIATGSTAGFDILDVDGEEGARSLLLYEEKHGPLPVTAKVATGGGGWHIFFAHVEGLRSRTRFMSGLDVRADGGYIVAPPSIHATSVRYEWEIGLDEAPLAPWPPALLSSIRGSVPSRNGSARSGGPTGYRVGARNDTLASLAGTMRCRGMGLPSIEAALLAENEASCQPPIDADEVRGIAASVVRYGPAAPVSAEPLPLTDVGNARRVVRYATPNLRYVEGWGWVFFDGRRWVRNALADATELAKRAAEGIWNELPCAGDKDEKKKVAAWALKSQDAYRIKAALDLAKSDPAVRTDANAFDLDPHLITVRNGTLDLRAGALQPHRGGDLITRLADVNYDPNAEAPRWHSFLQRVVPDAGIRGFLQRWFGYCLTGVTSEQSLVFLHGVGANGKTVLIETIRAVMGEYGRATPFSTFIQRRPDAASNDVAALVGVRMVVASEPDEGVRLSEALIKQVTGGELVSARFLYKEYFEFRPDFKICLIGNHRPQINGTDHGIWRRIMLVPFPVVVPKEEQDRGLAGRLREELPGILAWMVQGCREWQERGLKPPTGVLAATEQYRKEEDRLGRFLDEECVIEANQSVTAKVLREAYEAWCFDQGEGPLSQKRVGARLTDLGFQRKKIRRSWTWVGIGLVENTP